MASASSGKVFGRGEVVEAGLVALLVEKTLCNQQAGVCM